MPSRLLVTVVAVLAVATGCTGNPFKRPQAGPISLEPPPGVAAPAHTLHQPPSAVPGPAMPSYSSLDSRDLEVALSRSRQESQVMQDEIAALREQLASTSTQLAQERSTARPTAPVVASVDATPPVVMESTVGQLSLPGLEKRFDGGVVRIEVPADKLFEPGKANLLPGGAAILTQAAEEIERVYPGHFIGIEGHLDTEPMADTSWTSPHELTAARATSVFDFFTSRTPLGQGQLFIVAHGANHPAVSNATAAGRSRNRRIELVIYPERSGSGAEHPAARSPLGAAGGATAATRAAWQPAAP
ncbi:MAG: OmpA family protein [Planctomycetia bacterium]